MLGRIVAGDYLEKTIRLEVKEEFFKRGMCKIDSLLLLNVEGESIFHVYNLILIAIDNTVELMSYIGNETHSPHMRERFEKAANDLDKLNRFVANMNEVEK